MNESADSLLWSLLSPQNPIDGTNRQPEGLYDRFSNPKIQFAIANRIRIEWEKMDSNHRRRTSADLQSAPFGHSGILPICIVAFATIVPLDSNPRGSFWADGGIRTPDQLITNQLLWPTELHRHLTLPGCKGTNIFLICKFFANFFQKKFILPLSKNSPQITLTSLAENRVQIYN